MSVAVSHHRSLLQNLSLYAFVLFYGFAGAMHFIRPETYLEVIPDGLGDRELINYAAGATELLVALLALFHRTRSIAAYITIVMLVGFIISHVYFIQLNGCAGDFCLPVWIGYVRLIVIHPLLIYWAWKISRL